MKTKTFNGVRIKNTEFSRGEKLFDLLPFNSIATDTILKNHEYE